MNTETKFDLARHPSGRVTVACRGRLRGRLFRLSLLQDERDYCPGSFDNSLANAVTRVSKPVTFLFKVFTRSSKSFVSCAHCFVCLLQFSPDSAQSAAQVSGRGNCRGQAEGHLSRTPAED